MSHNNVEVDQSFVVLHIAACGRMNEGKKTPGVQAEVARVTRALAPRLLRFTRCAYRCGMQCSTDKPACC